MKRYLKIPTCLSIKQYLRTYIQYPVHTCLSITLYPCAFLSITHAVPTCFSITQYPLSFIQ